MTAPRDDEPRLVDAYLDALLTAPASTAAADHLHPPFAARLPALDDPRLGAAATALHTSLIRFHPSFRFEDRVAARLRAAARGEAWTPATSTTPRPTITETPTATIIAFPGTGADPAAGTAANAEADLARGLLLGGAIASGVSIAGAALYAWRRQRGGRSRTGIA